MAERFPMVAEDGLRTSGSPHQLLVRWTISYLNTATAKESKKEISDTDSVSF